MADAITLGPFATIVNVGWGGALIFLVIAEIVSHQPDEFLPMTITVDTTNFGVNNLLIADATHDLAALGLPVDADSFSVLRFPQVQLDFALGSVRQTTVAFNLSRIRNLFPSLPSLTISGSVDGLFTDVGLGLSQGAAVAGGFSGKSSGSKLSLASAYIFNQQQSIGFDDAHRGFSYEINMTDPNNNTLTPI
jgi:hypothetical protein